MGRIVSLPPRHTLDEVFDALAEIRALIEQLIVQPPSVREWLSVDQAAVLLHRTPQAVRFRCRNGLGVKNCR